MNLYLENHEYKYAAEQMLLTLYPTERPVYPEKREDGDSVLLRLEPDRAVCELTLTGTDCHDQSVDWSRNDRCTGQTFTLSIPTEPWQSELEKSRNEQRALKLAFYRAALAAGHPRPAWGALTGVKPGKLMARYLRNGKTAADFAADYDVSPVRAALCEQTTRCTLRADDSLGEKDICLYVGIPFCPTRCAYCSFISSAVGQNLKLMQPYLDALLQEIRQVSTSMKENGLRPVALYIGGGTPTTLSAEQLDVLCCALAAEFDFSALREYTVEAGRPDTLTADKLLVLKRHGVTRVSVNPQTMSDEVLEAIGRFHTAQDIVEALDLVRRCGGFEVNMDLIAGLPKDSEEGFRKTLDTVLALNPENITVHTLSLKNGSRLSEHPEQLPGPGAVAAMLDYAAERLPEEGYSPYYLYRQKYMSGGFENVGWARPGTENLYNICMMEELCDVVALGAGGSSKYPEPDGSIRRHVNPKYPKEYIERISSNR